MATHSSILVWKTPWTEEPGRLQSMGSQRGRHDWATSLTHLLCALNWCCAWHAFLRESYEDGTIITQVCRYGSTESGKLSEVTQSCPTFCESIDCSLPGSSVYGIFQARVLEWVAIAFVFNSLWPYGSIAHQTPLSMEFSRQEYWSELPCSLL